VWAEIRNYFIKYVCSREAKNILKQEFVKQFGSNNKNFSDFYNNLKLSSCKISRTKIALCVCESGLNFKVHENICGLLQKLFFYFASDEAETSILQSRGITYAKRIQIIEMLNYVRQQL